jgi:hypothetical protein
LSQLWSLEGHCFRECPRLVVALDAESKRLRAEAPKSGRFIPDLVRIENFSAADRDYFNRQGNAK